MRRLYRVYYDDGSMTLSDGNRDFVAELDGEGVIVIVQEDSDPGDPYAVGRELLFDADYYCWRAADLRWFRCDLYGLFDYLRRPGWKKVLAGRTVPRDIYKATLIKAQNDPDFPVKTAIQAGEGRLRDL